MLARNGKMSMRLRWYTQLVAAIGIVAIAASALPALSLLAVHGIENASCERVNLAEYTINFRSSPDAGAVEVFASSRPDRIDSTKPVAIIRNTPANVSAPGFAGRIYFHLKPASGPARVVSVRRLPLDGAKNFRDLGGYRSAEGQ